MGSDNTSSKPKRRRISPYLSTTGCMVVSFLLPFVFLLLMMQNRRLPDSHTHRRDRVVEKMADDADRHKASAPDHRHKGKEHVSQQKNSAKHKLPANREGVFGASECAGGRCPEVLSIEPSHGRTRGGDIITITGNNFGITASHLKDVKVGMVSCVSFTWVRPTDILCKAPQGTGNHLPITVAVDGNRGVSSAPEAMWKYDPPRILSVEPNHAPRAGGTVLIIRGTGFGASESFPVATVGGVPCQATRWISDEAVRCIAPKAQGVRLPVHVTVCGCGEASSTPQSTATSPNQLFSADEDTMHDSGRAIIHGLELRPHRIPLVMNRKQLSGDYEISFTDHIKGKTVYYGVPPELLTVIPMDDIKHRFDKCAVVGNSGSLVNTNFGNAIDEHTAVFRFHNAPTHRFEADVGSKTTFQVLDQFWTEQLMGGENGPQDVRWWVEEATLLLWSSFSQEAYAQLRQLFPTSSIMYMSRNLVHTAGSAAEKMQARIEETMKTKFRRVKREMSSVYYTTMFAMQVCGEVNMYGVDSRSGKYHYFDDYDPGDEERDSASLEYMVYLVLQSMGYINSIAERTPPAAAEDAQLELESVTCPKRECVVDCNRRGVYANGTCHCEPIYSGGDCSIDRMAVELDSLLGGLNIKYEGQIQMSKAEVNGTKINLPDGITRQKLREGDVYLVDRALYHALPDEDMKERYGTCAIVGNSGAMLNAEFGKDIDAHDFVYRFNQAPVKGYEMHVGSRASVESLNGYWVKQLLDEKRGYRWNWRSRETGLVLFEMFEPWAFIWKNKAQIYEKDRWWKASYVKLRRTHPDRRLLALSPNFVSWAYLLYRELRRRFQRTRLGRYPGEKPMSGFYAFLFALQVCDDVDIYGFQPYREQDTQGGLGVKYHYFDSAVPRPGSHSFDLARYIYQLFALRMDNVRIFD
mmetsp:Transcript_49733/g.158830  ORF Transcript_49733/g.158830 Transcript_49733/m.158830 type:complete len:920 (-) Transcript_49733:66-2825(-)|eukprot:CAMPEP_0182863964 /NCGR_PEP_ID=MMETSP0034_2-20130328/6925_1 /TAXON_ID=156128 /ORGANISM="Nephroselmis pyriformis, Strain CCMP717" /LENGTH=919 /DNA_ID=CAMNT_0024996209 /DNA_START=261 /DNA_END=3020 /DNA_ORIENTATION=-